MIITSQYGKKIYHLFFITYHDQDTLDTKVCQNIIIDNLHQNVGTEKQKITNCSIKREEILIKFPKAKKKKKNI